MNEPTQDLAIRQLTPATWDMIRQVAPIAHNSRLFSTFSADQATAIMLKGYELGLPLTASFDLISVIQGKPTLSPRGALAIILQSKDLASMNIDESVPHQCTVTMRRKSTAMEYRTTYTLEDANTAGLVKPDSNWIKWERNMLRWRAIGFVEDILFPDLLAGMKRADEFGAAIDEAGNVIEGEWSAVPSTPVTAAETPQAPTSSGSAAELLNEIVERHGAEAVMAAFDGGIPATDDEVAAVAAKLAAGNA
ncbi:MAG: hypothetical protein ACYC4L_05125 [Chloroflexota bacterium]